MRTLPTHAEARQPASTSCRSTPAPSTLAMLDDQALLGLLLGRCLPGANVDRIAEALLDRFGSLGDVAAAEVSELGRLSGLGPAAILPPQRIVLTLSEQRLELVSDGLGPFTVAPPAKAPP